MLSLPSLCSNSFNRDGHGVLPVAVLGTADLDASDIDVSTVRLMRADGVGGSVAPHEGPPGPHTVIEDVSTPFDCEDCACHDAGGDDTPDLLMHFGAGDVISALLLDGESPGALVELIVTGELLDGTRFTGSDCVRLVPLGTPPGVFTVSANLPASRGLRSCHRT